MPMTKTRMNAKIDEHFSFEGSDDVEGVLSTLAADAVHDVVGFPGGPTTGREGARPFYERMFADLAGSKVTPIRRLYGENFLVDESLWEGSAPGAPFGREGRNRPLTFRLLHVIEFGEDETIKSEQVWCDMTAIAQQLPQD
jgi:hypothetical protein